MYCVVRRDSPREGVKSVQLIVVQGCPGNRRGCGPAYCGGQGREGCVWSESEVSMELSSRARQGQVQLLWRKAVSV